MLTATTRRCTLSSATLRRPSMSSKMSSGLPPEISLRWSGFLSSPMMAPPHSAHKLSSRLAVVIDLEVAPFAGAAAVPVIFRDGRHALCEPSTYGWVNAVVCRDGKFGQTEHLGRLHATRTGKERAGEPDDDRLKLGVVADTCGERGNVAHLAEVARVDEHLVDAGERLLLYGACGSILHALLVDAQFAAGCCWNHQTGDPLQGRSFRFRSERFLSRRPSLFVPALRPNRGRPRD